MNSWLEALREWNNNKGGTYSVPKKGTKEHWEVLALSKRKSTKAKESKQFSPETIAKNNAAAEKKAAKMAATAAAREAKLKAKKEAAALAKQIKALEAPLRKAEKAAMLARAKSSFYTKAELKKMYPNGIPENAKLTRD